MPQYFFSETDVGTKYFSCTAAQSAVTSASQTGEWTTSLTDAKAQAFNTGEIGSREQIDVKLNFGSLYKTSLNSTVERSQFITTLFGCDTVDGDYESQGSSFTKYVDAKLGTVTTSNGEDAINSWSSATGIDTQTYNFMSKKKFWYIRVSMKVSSYLQMGFGNHVDIYAFVAMHDDGIIRKKYKTKTFMHGHGLQVMSGPKSYVRFGRNQNLIFGDLNIEGDTDGGGGGYFQYNLTVGKAEVETSHPLFVQGDIAATGNVIAYVSSDERLKTAITPLENSLEKVKRLNPIDFAWKSRDTGWGTESPVDMGLLAQDVEKQFPSIVKEMDDGYKGIRYDRLIPVLVDCIKTQDSKIDELKELVEKMIDKSKEE